MLTRETFLANAKHLNAVHAGHGNSNIY